MALRAGCWVLLAEAWAIDETSSGCGSTGTASIVVGPARATCLCPRGGLWNVPDVMATTPTDAARLPQVGDSARLFPWVLSLCAALAACGDEDAPHHSSSVERLATAVTAHADAVDGTSDIAVTDAESDIFDGESDTESDGES